jgi:hypothetical protein
MDDVKQALRNTLSLRFKVGKHLKC